MKLHDLCYDSCVKIAQLVFLDRLVEPEIIAFNSILDDVFETTLSNCCCIHQIFLNCYWCLNLWWKTNIFFTMLKWILSTLWYCSNVLIIFNLFFTQIFGKIFSGCKIDTFFEVWHKSSDDMTWQYLPLSCSIQCTYSIIIPPDPFCSLLIVCSMTWSGGSFLKLSLAFLTEKWPFKNR